MAFQFSYSSSVTKWKGIAVGVIGMSFSLVPASAQAAPTGGMGIDGSVSISQNGPQTTITQGSDKAIIDWQGFDIERGEQVRFEQPSAAAIALNRVKGDAPTHIFGELSANGRVMLINRNGIVFGPDSKVDVAGLVASTADIDNSDFMHGRFHFQHSGKQDAKIINEGRITIRNHGLGAFVAPTVINKGVITAELGQIQLAAGNRWSLNMGGSLRLLLEDRVAGELINQGELSANGGLVYLTANVVSGLVHNAITNLGNVEAKSVGTENGTVVFYAGDASNQVAGRVEHQGRIDVSGVKAGRVDLLGETVALTGKAVIHAAGAEGGGMVRVGGGYQGKAKVPNAKQTYMAKDARIDASAQDGDAGRVILWADDATAFHGHIEATSNSGIGGFVETSGKRALNALGNVNTSSLFGQTGTWLLDPNDITISNAADTASMVWNAGTGTFEDTVATPSNLNITTLSNRLGTNNVIVSTANGAGGNGDITIVDSIGFPWAGRSLTFQANRNINVNNNVIAHSASNLIFDAPAGTIAFAGGQITTNGGSTTITAANTTIADVNIDGVGLTLNTPITFNGTAGQIRTLSAKSGVLTINGAITGGTQRLYLTGDDMAINAAVASDQINVRPLTNNRSMGLAGAAGDLQLSVAELNNLTTTTRLHLGQNNTLGTITGQIDANAHNWGAYAVISLYTSNVLKFSGAQNFGNNNNSFFASDYNIGATLTGTNAISLVGQAGGIMGLAGAAGPTQIDTAELDHFSDGFSAITFGAGNNNPVVMDSYVNWKDPISFNPAATVTVNGLQQTKAGTNARFTFGSGVPITTITVNADIDAMPSNGTITIHENNAVATDSLNLGADLKAVGITVRRPINLTGAAGVTRTINVGTGTLILQNNGTTQLGSIAAGNRNLTLIGDNASYQGGISGTGNLWIQPFTNNQTIGLGNASVGGLNLTNGELDLITDGWSQIRFGLDNSLGLGAMDIRAYTWRDPLFLQTGSGVMTFNGTTTMGNNSLLVASDADMAIGANLVGTSSLSLVASGNNFKIGVGSGALCGGACDLLFDNAKLANLIDGWSTITFGNSSRPSAIDVRALTVSDPYIFATTSAGSVTLNGALATTAASNGRYTFNGPTAVNSAVDTSAANGGTREINFGNFNHTLAANLTSGGGDININGPTTLGGASGSTYVITAGTGTFTNSATGTFTSNNRSLDLIADNMTLGGSFTQTASGTLRISPGTGTRGVNLGTPTGGLDLDINELDRIDNGWGNVYIGIYPTYTGNTNLGGFTFYDPLAIFPTGTGSITFSGAVNMVNNGLHMALGSGDVDINAPLTSAGGNMTIRSHAHVVSIALAGGAGNVTLSSAQLDNITDGWNLITLGNSGQPITVGAYSNWRDPVNFTGNSVAAGNTAINGAQAAAAGSNTTFTFNGATAINANVDLSNATGGTRAITFANTSVAGAHTLNADVLSGGGTITLNGAMNLGGAAGVTRTLNAGTGALTINNNGTTQLGAITSGNRNLSLISDTLTLGGALSGSANLTFGVSTAGRSMGIGGGAGLWNLDNTEISKLTDGWSNLIIDSNGGHSAMEIGASSWTDPLTMRTGTANLTVSGIVDSSIGNNNLAFVTNGQFINLVGAGAFNMGTGRFLAYLIDAAHAVKNGLSASELLGKTYAGNPPASIAAGNYFLYSILPAPQAAAGDPALAPAVPAVTPPAPAAPVVETPLPAIPVIPLEPVVVSVDIPTVSIWGPNRMIENEIQVDDTQQLFSLSQPLPTYLHILKESLTMAANQGPAGALPFDSRLCETDGQGNLSCNIVPASRSQ